MSAQAKVIVRNAREQDLPAIMEIDSEAFAPYGTAQKEGTFQHRLVAFPNGFVILVAENEVAGYGCSERWLVEHDLVPVADPSITHQPDGRIFCITAMAVRKKFRGRGYGLVILDRLLETAHLEGCRKVVLETSQAQNLYLKRGFKIVKNRMERGVSVDVMSLDLEPIRMTG